MYQRMKTYLEEKQKAVERCEKLGENFEDYLYAFNYSPFSNSDKNAEDLHDYIETIIKDNKVGADTVVLVPMSMGA